MKRETLFKGKDLDGIWRFGNLFYLTGVNGYAPFIQVVSDDKRSYSEYEVHPETVCRSVKDDLFENDILRSINHYEKGEPYYSYHIIQWSERFCGWFAKNKNNLGKEDTNGDVQLWVYLKNTEFEIIGNIQD